MREILFRGKTKIGNFWFEGAYIPKNKAIIGYFEVGEYDPDRDMMNCKCVVRKVLPETVGQYTGLTDKNGKRIFEGDIVRVPMHKAGEPSLSNYMTGFVEWLNGAFSVKWVDTQYGRHFIGYLEDIEVIGNIHDNPELLEGF